MKSLHPLLAFAAVVFVTAPDNASAKGKTVVVSPAYPQGWVFETEGTGTGSLGFAAGPVAAPQGVGSLTLGAGPEQGSLISTAACAGVRLKDLKALNYRTSSTGTGEAPVLQLEVDFDLKDAATPPQGLLVYEPALNGTATSGTWQTWNAFTGKWYMTGTAVAA